MPDVAQTPQSGPTGSEMTTSSTSDDGATAGGPGGGSGSGRADEPIVETVPDRLRRVELFGLPLVDASSLDPVADQIMVGAEPDGDLLPLVLTPNVDIIVHLDANPDRVETALFRRAQYCLPDGQPVVVASRLLRRRLGSRLAGSTLFSMLWPRLVAKRVPMVVLASSEVVAEAMAADGPVAEFVVPPMFDADDDETIAEIADDLIAAAERVRPRMLLLGIGNPKDARVIGAVLDRWDTATLGPLPLSMGLGASFALHLGLKKRAPMWVQKIGMEWFHRFLQEPRRLYRRYFIEDLRFIGIVWRERRVVRRARVGR